MGVDLSQFLQTFFEESFEGLDIMEAGLLELDPGAPDIETLHNVFRAAHSIKGGSGTFGLSQVSEFTHRLETLLDRLREGEQAVTPENISALLESVDCLRGMLEAARDGTEHDTAAQAAVEARLDAELGNPTAPAAPPGGGAADGGPTGGPGGGGGWRIRFAPEPYLFTTGNDPLRIFSALEELGEVTVVADLTGLPPLEALDAEECRLAWTLELRGDADEAAVREVFEWVEDDAELEITPLAEAAGGAAASAPVSSSPPVAASALAATVPAPAGGGASAAPGAAKKGGAGAAAASSIRVDTGKIDVLIDMVGELVITQSMLSQVGKEFSAERLEELQDGLAQLERNTRELQDSVMRIRMVPISFAYSRLPRIVHDVSRGLGKEVELVLEGEQTELDKTVMEKIIDPLVHLVRNAVDHGVEPPEERRAAGKPETGTLRIEAYHKGGNIIIEITDDGRGINRAKLLEKARAAGLVDARSEPPDEQIYELIFHPGLSTHDEATEYSGRGVGMDVVKRNIRELSGNISVHSEPGKGTVLTISLPLTLSILDGQLFRVGDETYIVPLVSIIESLQIQPDRVSGLSGEVELYHWREGYIPMIRLHELFGVVHRANEGDEDGEEVSEAGLLVVVEDDNRHVGLRVDELLDQQQVVIKSLEENFLSVPGFAGATILGNGMVALILDIAGLVDLGREASAQAAGVASESAAAAKRAAVDESQDYLSFVIGDEEYAVDVRRVQEIRGWEAPTPIPNAPPHVHGVVNLRGAMPLILDMRTRFGLPRRESYESAVVILVRVKDDGEDQLVGLVVDAPSAVHTLSRRQIRSAPQMRRQGGDVVRGLANVDEKIVIVLDVDRLFGEEERAVSEQQVMA